MKKMKRHPLSAEWGDMGKREYKMLVEDIAKHGPLNPIYTLDDKILDGWHRYQACIETGKEPVIEAFTGNPVPFVISQNAMRRNYEGTVRSQIIARLLGSKWAKAGRPGVTKNTTIKEAATKGGVSERSLSRAKRIAETSPKLAKGVEKGELTANQAEAIIKKGEAKSYESAKSPETKKAVARRATQDMKAKGLDKESREINDLFIRLSDEVSDFLSAVKQPDLESAKQAYLMLSHDGRGVNAEQARLMSEVKKLRADSAKATQKANDAIAKMKKYKMALSAKDRSNDKSV